MQRLRPLLHLRPGQPCSSSACPGSCYWYLDTRDLNISEQVLFTTQPFESKYMNKKTKWECIHINKEVIPFAMNSPNRVLGKKLLRSADIFCGCGGEFFKSLLASIANPELPWRAICWSHFSFRAAPAKESPPFLVACLFNDFISNLAVLPGHPLCSQWLLLQSQFLFISCPQWAL